MASSVGSMLGTDLSLERIPEIEVINRGIEFSARVMSDVEFDRLWLAAGLV
jgi:hypothetical protein